MDRKANHPKGSRRLKIGMPTPWPTPSYDAVAAFSRALERVGAQQFSARTRTGQILWRIPGCMRDLLIVRHQRTQYRSIVGVMGVARLGALVYSVFAKGRTVPYVWDLWEPDAEKWVKAFHTLNVDAVIVNSTAGARALAEGGFPGRVLFLPEAIDLSTFDGRVPLSERSTSVLEMGRVHSAWHDAISPHLVGGGYVHRFQTAGSPRLFETHSQLASALGDTRVVACFPRSMTHPEEAGTFEVLTQRYLEVMASGCIPIGHCPRDLEQFFGYNPVVEVDWTRPGEQIVEILESSTNFTPLVQRNLEVVRDKGDWIDRARSIVAFVAELDS